MEAIQSRIDEYLRTIDPILEYYHQKDKLIRVDGERPIEVIHRDIVKEINQRV
jgi:adenylate kinase family enzyme